MNNIKKLLILFPLLVNCSSYQITENKGINQKEIIWISASIGSDNTRNFTHPNDSANLSLRIANQLNNLNNKKDFRVVYNKDQKYSNFLIDIQIRLLSSKTEIPEKSLLPTILTAGLFLLFGGDSYEDTLFAKIEISIFDENKNKIESKPMNFLHKRQYNIYSYIFPFIDYRVMNLSDYNPRNSLIFSDFICDNIITLIKNEN
ncbi:hypothetical protein EHQ94_19685 [Leptospira meyeri]|uniref:hypothetical protein n=1 Tax=Leptospira meyeri TaxID=29508 RepID=UPI001083E6AD|nr:hypothetical protein [Leptospira meyeri]TGM62985.1 hypothetical protein EHQ94_19685 [Leptospira meyeri]TGM68622.1 hypothetical protein EHQ93_00200 [Leptospira meyeri]